MKDRTDWKQPRGVQPDRPLAVDLFASHLTNQLPCYFNCRTDLEAEAMNASSQQWYKLGGRITPTPHGVWWAESYPKCQL